MTRLGLSVQGDFVLNQKKVRKLGRPGALTSLGDNSVENVLKWDGVQSCGLWGRSGRITEEPAPA